MLWLVRRDTWYVVPSRKVANIVSSVRALLPFISIAKTVFPAPLSHLTALSIFKLQFRWIITDWTVMLCSKSHQSISYRYILKNHFFAISLKSFSFLGNIFEKPYFDKQSVPEFDHIHYMGHSVPKFDFTWPQRNYLVLQRTNQSIIFPFYSLNVVHFA